VGEDNDNMLALWDFVWMLKACWLQVVEEDLSLLLQHQGAGGKRQLAEAVVGAEDVVRVKQLTPPHAFC